MIYSKLPVVFLSTIASEKNGSINCMIASYLLDHLKEVQNIGIKEMADKCHVAMSSISRFCKEIGLRDFTELKELLNCSQFYFEEQSDSKTFEQRIHDYNQKITESITMVEKTINKNQILKLCQDIHQYQKIALFGLLKAGSVAMNLQSDLLMLGKQVYTNISYLQQIDYIVNGNQNDLIIIFSYTGSYFDYQDLRELKKKLYAPKIWMISSNKEHYPDFVDEIISFESLQDQGSHPYQLQFVGSLIAQEYAKLNEK